MDETWETKAAREIDILLGRAVQNNTGIKTGFFSGVSIKDIADIITKQAENAKKELQNA